LRFLYNGRYIRGFCRLYKDRLAVWEDPAAASRDDPVEGSIPFSEVVAWKIHKDMASGGKVACDSISLYCGQVMKQVQFDSAEDAAAWTQALRKVLMPPIEHGTFQAWKPDRPRKNLGGGGGNFPKGQHHLSSTAASRAPLYREVQLAAMKATIFAPASCEDLKRLDAEARGVLKDERTRKKVVGTITSMRTRMRDAAWTAGGSDWGKLFRLEDRDHSGRLDWDEFRSMCRRVLKINETVAPDAHIRAVFQSLDVDKSGELDLEELVAFVDDPVQRMRFRLNAAIGEKTTSRAFFDKQDIDKSGTLDWEEFEVMCRRRLDIIDDESQLAMVFEALDYNDDGVVSLAEFVAFMQAAGDPPPGLVVSAIPGRALPMRTLSDSAIKPLWVK
jgi:Ca2+-binding EF-hand superfamily protein